MERWVVLTVPFADFTVAFPVDFAVCLIPLRPRSAVLIAEGFLFVDLIDSLAVSPEPVDAETGSGEWTALAAFCFAVFSACFCAALFGWSAL